MNVSTILMTTIQIRRISLDLLVHGELEIKTNKGG
jgi:hypothetical protein